MKLWKHLRAHWRTPFYAFCEWYVFGRDGNWEDVPAPVVVDENDLPDAEIKRMWDEGTPVTLTDWRGSFRCEHMQASGLRMLTCGVCGPVRRVRA